jgi:hypothetical protein
LFLQEFSGTISKMDAGTESAGSGVVTLLKSIADLISAVAWPALVGIFLIRYRKEVGAGVAALSGRLSQAEGLELGPLKIAMKKSAELAGSIPKDPEPEDQQKAIRQQTKVGKELRAEVIDDPAMLSAVRRQMDNLARQYELLRAARDAQSRMATDAEIVQMNKVVSQMRALALSCVPYWKDYAESDRPGDHLVAVVIVQMSPDPRYLDWLQERFTKDRPFVFYHAALALQNMADQCWMEARDQIKRAAQAAFDQMKAFRGQPDAKTVRILEAILART